MLKTPVFLLAVHQELVEKEENPFLNVSRRNLQEDAVHEQLRACIGDIGALQGNEKVRSLGKKSPVIFKVINLPSSVT